MADDSQLSEAEKSAKEFILNMLLKETKPFELCDYNYSEDKFALPEFYDEAKFKRGQKYFLNNRYGLIQSTTSGVLTIICDPGAYKLLNKTERTNTTSSSRMRYVDTTLHLNAWCSIELKPGSRSWESLKRVRKMHYFASNVSLGRKELGIPQTWMTLAEFAFVGYAFTKPHMLGIKNDCLEDREAFAHMWAVIFNMLGIKDEFNICLHPLDTVETICHILIRYNFTPLLQLETKLYETLARAFVSGMKWYIQLSTYKAQMFLARRLAGIPGYQYDVDLSKEFYLKQLFTMEELEMLRTEYQNVKDSMHRINLCFDEKIPIINFDRTSLFNSDNDSSNNSYGIYKNLNDNENEKDDHEIFMLNFLDLKHPSQLEIIKLDDEKFKDHLSDKKFKKLCIMDQIFVKKSVLLWKLYGTPIIRPIVEKLNSIGMEIMRKQSIYFKNIP